MLKNFLRTAVRNIVKYKAYSLINFIGLTSGLALSLLIVVYVDHEMSYDNFHQKIDRLYRIAYTVPNGLRLAATPPPIAPVLGDYFPEVEQTARVYGRNVSVSRSGSRESFEEPDVFFADSTITKLFTFDFVRGNTKHLLQDKFSVVINEEIAHKYFGDENPIGESLTFGGSKQFKVVAVARNFGLNSHIRFNIIAPYESMYGLENDRAAQVLKENLAVNFVISHSYTYVLLRPGADPHKVDAGMTDFLKKYAQPALLIGQVFELMPVKDIHLKSDLMMEPTTTNTWTNLYIFIGVGFLTLIIASINYINMSTAQSLTRIKEIGIRKILGSMRYQLIVQFLAEGFIFCALSMIIAYGAFYIALPLLNVLTHKTLGFADVVDSRLILFSVGLVMLMTLMAGLYPAYFVTRFESISALKSGSATGMGDQYLRKSLVVFQLAIASMLLSGSLLIIKQLNFLESRPLGFDKEQMINIPLYSNNLNAIFSDSDSSYRLKLQTFRNIVEAQSDVRQTTFSSGPPGLGATYRGAIPDGFTKEDNLFVACAAVDYDFLSAYGMELSAGRSFSRDFGSDENEAFLINEAAVREFKWESPQAAIGKIINREGKKGAVIGVLRDFNFVSMTTPLTALILEVDQSQFNTMSIKFTGGDGQTFMKKLETDWNRIFPEKAFEYSYLDERLNTQYASFQDFGSIIQIFTGIAVVISGLGVYGLVLFTVQRKVKEIGVRKVLGANIRSILIIIYRDFAMLLVVAFLTAVPASYYFMNQWLNNFTYRTNIDALIFAMSLLLILAIVSATISYQAVRAARTNPVNSLRSE